jgi:DNA-binding XRE family transcriptional regulator
MAEVPQTALQFVAFYRKQGRTYAFEFPDVPGCVGTAANKGELYEKAKATLEAALRDQLRILTKLPNWPQLHRPSRAGEERLHVRVAPSFVIAIQFRRMRLMKGWSQAELASHVGVSQQQIDKLEDPDCNPTFETVTKVARAFGEPLMVAFG